LIAKDHTKTRAGEAKMETREQISRISLRDVLFILFSKWHVFLGIFLLIVFLTMGFAYSTQPRFKSTARIIVKPLLETNLKLMAPLPQTFVQVSPVRQEDINTEVGILQSRKLLEGLVDKLGLAEQDPHTTVMGRLGSAAEGFVQRASTAMNMTHDEGPMERAVRMLQKSFEIKPLTLSNTIQVTLKGEDPQQTARVLNTFLEDYIDHHIDIYKAKGAKEFYAEQASLFAGKLRRAEDELETFKRQWAIIEIEGQNQANIELLRTLRQSLALSRGLIEEMSTRVLAQKSNLEQSGEIGALTAEFRNDAILEELVRTLGPLLAERERIAQFYREENPNYKVTMQQVDQFKMGYDKQIRELLEGSSLDLDALSRHADVIQAHIAKLEKESLLLSEKQVEFNRLVREVLQNEQNYLLYQTKTEEARIEEQQDANRVSNIKVASWAEPPTIPYFPNKPLLLLLSVLVGLVVATAGAFAAYYVDHSVKTPEELSRYTGLPVFTVIGYVPRGSK
jgi:uncharacterized protein involved in exopolysaccharide biosynthesis